MKNIEMNKILAEKTKGMDVLEQKKIATQIKPFELSTPDWQYIQSQFTNNIREIWARLIKLDYNDVIVELIQTINTAPKPTQATLTKDIPLEQPDVVKPIQDQYFVAKGIDSTVPKYLRTKENVLNRHLTKSHCLILIKDTWDAKLLYEQQSSVKIHISDFFYLYLKKRFFTQQAICEWGYNLTEALKVYQKSSVDCYMFYNILFGINDESLYYDFQKNIEALKSAIVRMDLNVHFQKKLDWLELSEFMECINELYPDKARKQIKLLEKALTEDIIGDKVNYQFLFKSEGESIFFETLKEQAKDERLQYIKEIDEGFKRISGGETITVFEALKFFREKDFAKKSNEVDELVARCFNLTVAEMKPKSTISKKDFLEVLY
jgi:hypothetical protein